MLTKQKMQQLFEDLNEKLKQANITGEICIVGGAAMTLAYNARIATNDIDAVFDPKLDIQVLAMDVGKEHGMDIDWLNDAVKIFLPDSKPKAKKILFRLSNLFIWSPEAPYLLAMKCISARPVDIRDIQFLIHLLKITDAKRVFEVIKEYYPKKKISEKSMNIILSIFEDL